VLLQKQLRGAVGFLFRWKFALMTLVLLSCLFIHRPFCKYLCPLGAFYALFQKVSMLRMALDKEKCVSCGKCEKACPMGVKVTADPNSAECIRCGACVRTCPAGALHFCGGKGKSENPAIDKEQE
jgi:polyferredoxin